MTDEPKKNHWYEMYELECLKTKELEAQIEKMKCCGNCDWKIKGVCNDNNCGLEDWKLVDTWR